MDDDKYGKESEVRLSIVRLKKILKKKINSCLGMEVKDGKGYEMGIK